MIDRRTESSTTFTEQDNFLATTNDMLSPTRSTTGTPKTTSTMWSSTARSVLVIQILLVLICSYSANAFPAGAGACPGGEAAVGSPHKEGREVTTGSLSDGGFGVAINDIFLLVDDEPVSITVAELNNITLQATDETLFKGFLIRIGPPPGTANSKDLRNSIYPYGDDTMAQIATTPCVETEFVGGLTQTNSDFKSQVTGSLLLEEVMDEVSVDVTGTS